MAKHELHDMQGNPRGWYSDANRLNDLTGREWVFWTRSVITKPYPPNLQHRLRSVHGGQKPPELCADLIRTFSKAGQAVLDPFMGVGGVLLGATLAGRRATGVEINPKWIGIYREVCRQESLPEQETITGDAEAVLEDLKGRSYDLVLTDVPYWIMDRAPRSRGSYKRVGEAARPPRASKLSEFGELYASKAEWLQRLGAIFAKAASLLKPAGYLLTFIGDMYRDNEYHCLSAELAAQLRCIPGFVWKASLVWYDVSKKLHLYGYQYSWIPSMIHQNILVFRREA